MTRLIEIGGLKFHIRNERDMAVCQEIVLKKAYEKPRLGFKIKPGETWLDCGCNIGVFSVWAEKARGAKVIGFEPFKENAELAQKNLAENECRSEVRICFIGSKNEGMTSANFNAQTPARSSAFSKGEQRWVKNCSIHEQIKQYKPSGLKIDIEGGEFDILDTKFPLDGVRALAMEYHFRFNKNCIIARKRIEWIKNNFRYNSIPKTIYDNDVWPAWQDTMLFFWN